MKVLFLTLLDFSSFSTCNIYCDLLREFIENGDEVYCVSPTERRFGGNTRYEESGHLLKLKIGNTQKTNLIEKGISTLLMGRQFKNAIKKYYGNIKFDLILYSTPPITLLNAVRYVKARDNAKTYLMLKDIFPQNAVDIGMLSKTGLKGIAYRFFRKKEKKLYSISDRIGCMSQANADYIISHNNELDKEKVGICPNSIEVTDRRLTEEQKETVRKKYGIPLDKKVFVYGGNLGKPQGIPFIIDCLRAGKENGDVYYLIIGDGTEYGALDTFVKTEKQENVRLMKYMPKDEYDSIISACDIGMVFLDHRFTIPNFPSRILSYMQAGLPVLACTDRASDIGKVIMTGGFGWWCESNNTDDFSSLISQCISSDLRKMGDNGFSFLLKNYTSKNSYDDITNSWTDL